MVATRTMAYQIPAELQRTEALATVQPEKHTPLRAVAQRLSRRGVAAAKVELANAALVTLVDLLYETDDDGQPSNVDADGRILVALPWGRLGHRQWGLRRTEANALRWLMLTRIETHGDAWLIYDAAARCWLVNLAFNTKRAALIYWRQWPVTLTEWRAATSATRSAWADQNLTSR